MSTDWTCNSSFWTKEEDKIFENTLAIYFKDKNLLTKMAEALPGKSRDDIINHYNILIEDVAAIESGRVPLPNYPEVQCDSNQNPKADVEWRRGAAWTELEHRSFLRGLNIYGRGDWKSISRNCVKTRTSTQVASHAQKYFKRLKAVPKQNRRASILDITSADAEATGTSQAVPSTNNESMFPRESTNAEQIIAVAEEEPSGHNAAFVNGMDSLYPDVNDEFILGGIDDIIMEKEDENETGFLLDAGISQLYSKQPCTAASSGTYQVPSTEDMIGPASGGSQAVPSTNNESMLPRENSNAEQMIAVAGGESSGHNAAFVNAMNSLYPDVNDKFINGTDDLIMEQEDANESGFRVEAGRSLLPSEQPFTAASSGTYSHPITRIGSELEALITEHMDEDNDINSIFDVGKAPTSHAMLFNAAHSGISSYAAARFGAKIAPENNVAALSGMSSYEAANFSAKNAPENNVATHSGMSSYEAAKFSAKNAPENNVAAHSGMTISAVASIGATNAPQNTVAAHAAQLPPFAPSSNFGVGDAPI